MEQLRTAQRDGYGTFTEGPRLMETIDHRVELPVSELLECAVVAGRFVEPDERAATGSVWLSGSGGHRIWRAVGSAVTLELRGDRDPARYDLLVPARLLNAGALVAGGGDTVTLTAGTEGGRSAVELSGPGAVVTVTSQPGSARDRHPALSDDETAASTVIETAVLREVLALATQVPYGFDRERTPWPVMTISIAAGTIEIAVDWPIFGPTRHVVRMPTSGAGSAVIMPGAFAALLDAYTEDEILLKLPRLPCDPVELCGDGWTGSVPQVEDEGDWPARAEEVILEAFGPEAAEARGERFALVADPDVTGRFSREPPWRLELSTNVLTGVSASLGLLSELNDHNRHLGLARVAFRDGVVVMQADLLIESLDAAELRTTVDWIQHHATELGPVLATVFGGTETKRTGPRP